ncbi:hypothetical protein Trydic_g9540 [Trypoxylus dichotomus]
MFFGFCRAFTGSSRLQHEDRNAAGLGPLQETRERPNHEGRKTNQRRYQGIINPKGRTKKTINIRKPITKTVRTAKDTQTWQPFQTDR